MKKIIKLLTMSIFACTALAGCGAAAPPTAEELVQGAYPQDMLSMKADMSLNFEAAMSMEDFGADGNMELVMEMEADMESDEDTTLLNGKAKVKVFGMTIEQKMKEYTQIEGDTQTRYSWSDEEDVWTYVTEDAEEKEKTKSIDPAIFRDLNLKETTKEDTEYIVIAGMYIEDIAKIMDVDIEDMMNVAGTEEMDYKDVAFDIEFTFDKETKYLTGFSIDLQDVYSQDGTEISVLSVGVENIEFSNESVEIPSSVIREAVEENKYTIDEPVYLEEPMNITTEDDEAEEDETPASTEPLELFEDSEIEDDFETCQAGEIEAEEIEDETDGMSGGEDICKEFFGMDYIYEADLVKIANGKLQVGDDVNIKVISLLCYNTKQEFLDYVKYWDYYHELDKLACAYVSDLGVVTYDEMVEAGADADELKELLKNINS